MTLEDFSNLSYSMIPFIILCAVEIVNVLLPPEINSSRAAFYWGAFPALQQERRAELAEPKKARATFYIATVKDTLSQQNYELFSKALQQYKKTDDFHAMLSQMSSLFVEDEKKHVLLRGTFRVFVHPWCIWRRDFRLLNRLGYFRNVLDVKYNSIKMIHHFIFPENAENSHQSDYHVLAYILTWRKSCSVEVCVILSLV